MSPLPVKIALCFFGITRSLRFTLPSIETNVLQPLARAAADTGTQVRIFSHFYDQARIDNARTGENGETVRDEHLLLNSDWLRLEAPGAALDRWDFTALSGFGDRWADDFASLRNLIHQLHSLRQVSLAALDEGAQVVVFARPDLRYHDSLDPAIRRALRHPDRALVQLPDWQSWAGRNDRFAVVSGTRAIRAYGCRIEEALTFCQELRRPMHSEELLLYALDKADIPVRTFPLRASRVRLDGSEKAESFSPPGRKRRLKAALRKMQRKLQKRLGMNPPLRLPSPPP